MNSWESGDQSPHSKTQTRSFHLAIKKDSNEHDEKESWTRQIGLFVTIPFVLAVSPIIGWLIGSWLDKKLDTAPYLMYLFLFIGFVAGFRELYRIIKEFGNGT